MLRTVLIISTALILLTACQYALSPWEKDLDCPQLWVPDNIARIQAIEESSGIKDHFKVAVLGDPQMYPESLQDTVEILDDNDEIDFIFLLGDLVEIGIKQEYEWICKALSHTSKPIISVIGNHDSLSYGKEIWLENIGPYDFSFTYQNTKFIAYNDNKYEFENVPDRSWLANEAAVADGETRHHTIGASHIAPWDTDLQLSEFLMGEGFDHMIHAHQHRFDYWQLLEVGLPHYIVADVRDVNFGIITIYPNSNIPITIENCTPDCLPAAIRNK